MGFWGLSVNIHDTVDNIEGQTGRTSNLARRSRHRGHTRSAEWGTMSICGYFFFVFIWELVAFAQGRLLGMQIKKRFWIMTSQEQCQVSGSPIARNSLDSSDTMSPVPAQLQCQTRQAIPSSQQVSSSHPHRLPPYPSIRLPPQPRHAARDCYPE